VGGPEIGRGYCTDQYSQCTDQYSQCTDQYRQCTDQYKQCTDVCTGPYSTVDASGSTKQEKKDTADQNGIILLDNAKYCGSCGVG
jgi:hypothetical protein